jgi:hypothetical protein
MILDDSLEFASSFALPTGSTGTFYVSDNVELGADPTTGGGDLSLLVQSSEDVTSGGSAFVTFILASDATGNIATDGSATEHFGLGPYPFAVLKKGFRVAASLPPGPYEQHLGLLIKITGAALTGGRFSAGLVETSAAWHA